VQNLACKLWRAAEEVRIWHKCLDLPGELATSAQKKYLKERQEGITELELKSKMLSWALQI
jgi:hypothetical protein